MTMKNTNTLSRVVDVIILIVLSAWGIAILYPFYNSVLVSVSPEQAYIRTPFMLFPKEITFDAYRHVFRSNSLIRGIKVTTVILFAGILYNMTLTTFTAYALTKPIPGRKFFTYFIIFTMYFTGGLIPFYLLMSKMGLIDSILSMILPTGISFSYMVIIRNYFENLPPDLEESAKIDGATDITILIKIILPLSLPILATFALYYGVERWNEWWLGMLFVKSTNLQPLQLVLRNIILDAANQKADTSSSNQSAIFSDGLKMASIVVTMFPVMCLYPFLQRYFVTGLTLGAVKG